MGNASYREYSVLKRLLAMSEKVLFNDVIYDWESPEEILHGMDAVIFGA